MPYVEFREFRLDLATYQLHKNGQPAPIGSRPLDLLMFLIENRHRVVDIETLRQEVWGGARLSPAAIPTCISSLRKVLDDSSTDPKFIQSVKNRGYRFIASTKWSAEIEVRYSSGTQDLKFEGREAEIDLLKELAQRVSRTRRGHIALVSGVAGIGKSRLARELATFASKSLPSVIATCSPATLTTPFRPWVQILNDSTTSGRGHTPRHLHNLRALAQNFPEIAFSGNANPRDADDGKRKNIIDCWISAIQSTFENNPHLIILEDAHRADPDSLNLLSCLSDDIHTLPALIIATHRPVLANTATSERLAEIRSSEATSTIDLKPLTDEAASQIINQVPSRHPLPVATITSQASGNPFFLTHLIKLYANRTEPHREATSNRIAITSAKELLARILSNLPTLTRAALEPASLIGESFSINILSHVLRASPVETARLLDPAVEEWVLSTEGTTYRFTHALIRDSLKTQIPALRRRETHLSIARALQRRPDARRRAAEISSHLLGAQPLSGEGETIDTTLLAGEEAISRLAYASARRHYTDALRLIEGSAQISPERHCEALCQLASCMLYMDERDEARSTLISAAAIARQARLPASIARCALLIAPDFLSIEVGAHDPSLAPLIEEALRGLPHTETDLRAQLLARLSQARIWERAPDDAATLANEALRLANRTGDPNTLVAALSAKAETLHGFHAATEKLSVVYQLRDSAQEARDIPATLLQLTREIAIQLELGNLCAVKALNEKHRILCSEARLPQFSWYPIAIDTMLALLKGELRAAEELSHTHQIHTRGSTDRNSIQTLATHGLILLFERDMLEDALDGIAQIEDDHRLNYAWRIAFAFFLAEQGRLREAEAAIRCFTPEDVEAMVRIPGASGNLALFAAACARVGDRSICRRIEPFLNQAKDYCATIGYGIGYMGSMHRYIGLVSRALGDLRGAARHFEIASIADRSRGALSWAAYAEVDFHLTTSALTGASGPQLELLSNLACKLDCSELDRAKRIVNEAIDALSAESTDVSHLAMRPAPTSKE